MTVHPEAPDAEETAILIKKYANRRLYNTETSSYITLDDLFEMVKEDVEFVVRDAKTEEDLTRQVLVQIIFEQESNKVSMLPIGFLRTFIQFYDGGMKEMVPPYMEAMMQNFSQNQDKIKEYVGQQQGGAPFAQLEAMGKQNAELFQKAFSMFSPFDHMFGGSKPGKK